MSAEGEELSGQLGGTVGGLYDFLGVLEFFVRFRHLGEDELARHAYHGEDVVEVVRDPTSEATNSFHLLGLAELTLERFLLTAVADGTNYSLRIAIRSPEDAHQRRAGFRLRSDQTGELSSDERPTSRPNGPDRYPVRAMALRPLLGDVLVFLSIKAMFVCEHVPPSSDGVLTYAYENKTSHDRPIAGPADRKS